MQNVASHLSHVKERFLPRDKGKEQLEDIKSVLTKSLVLSEGFNTSTLLKKMINKFQWSTSFGELIIYLLSRGYINKWLKLNDKK